MNAASGVCPAQVGWNGMAYPGVMGIGGVAVAMLLILMLIARLYLIDRNKMGKSSRYLDIVILVLFALFLADLATIVLF